MRLQALTWRRARQQPALAPIAPMLLAQPPRLALGPGPIQVPVPELVLALQSAVSPQPRLLARLLLRLLVQLLVRLPARLLVRLPVRPPHLV